MAKFKIFNKTMNREETTYGDSKESVIGIFGMVSEEIEILEELEDDRVSNEVQPKKEAVNVVTTEQPLTEEPVLQDDQNEQVYTKTEPKYFTLGDQQLMMEGAILYHKVWTDIEDVSEYRIMSTKTGKQISMENKQVQKLTWTPMEDGSKAIPTEFDESGDDIDE